MRVLACLLALYCCFVFGSELLFNYIILSDPVENALQSSLLALPRGRRGGGRRESQMKGARMPLAKLGLNWTAVWAQFKLFWSLEDTMLKHKQIRALLFPHDGYLKYWCRARVTA